MKPDEVLALQADVAAEANLAVMQQHIRAQSPEVRFTEEQINTLRAVFKMGWLTGYSASLGDTASALERLVSE